MEEYLSTFVRSIFVDNMIFAYYRVCVLSSCFQERKDCFRIGYGCNVHPGMYVADQLYARKLYIERRRHELVGR